MRHSPLPANASMKWTVLRYHINFKTHQFDYLKYRNMNCTSAASQKSNPSSSLLDLVALVVNGVQASLRWLRTK